MNIFKEVIVIRPFQTADTFWTNPQIKLSLTERDEGQEGCTFLAALMQKDRRRLKRFGANMLTIGYAIYQVGDLLLLASLWLLDLVS